MQPQEPSTTPTVPQQDQQVNTGPSLPPTQNLQPVQPTQQMILPPKKNHTLAIALIIALVFLIAAAVTAWWIFNQKNFNLVNTLTNQQTNAQDTTGVKSVGWVAPELPANYVKTDQSTSTSTSIYYNDTDNTCSISVGVSAIPAGSKAKDIVLSAFDAVASLGITTSSSSDGTGFTFKDVDGTHAYDFPSLNLVQAINNDKLSFKEQNNIVAYKQFGEQLATIGMACKSQSWDAQKSVLDGLVKQFTVKTER